MFTLLVFSAIFFRSLIFYYSPKTTSQIPPNSKLFRVLQNSVLNSAYSIVDNTYIKLEDRQVWIYSNCLSSDRLINAKFSVNNDKIIQNFDIIGGYITRMIGEEYILTDYGNVNFMDIFFSNNNRYEKFLLTLIFTIATDLFLWMIIV